MVRNYLFINILKYLRLNFSLFLLSLSFMLHGQATGDIYGYRIYFSDKGNISEEAYPASYLLSERAIERREKAGIKVPDLRDIPVYTEYLTAVSSTGLRLHCTSKWMNTALYMSNTPADITQLLNMPFISEVRQVKTPVYRKSLIGKLDLIKGDAEDIPYDRPITMTNGYLLHDQGYIGNGILIAVLDGGFDNAEDISSLTDLRNRKGIKATYDFVENNRVVYNSSTHGTAVLSVLAGDIPEEIEGTARGADYLLLKTEDVNSEFPCEEDFWAAGAEFADSAGSDIITSSLGYYNFDDPALDYKHSDLDGNTAFVTRVADIAASKGILVFNSAGNERNKDWIKIICPADGDSVMAVGAVDANNNIASFSSSGPSYDNRIKPDNTAMGVSVPVQTSGSEITRLNGTSFSCPVLSGIAACLMQAVPEALNTDIISVLHSSAHKSNSPDSLYGFGIPDMGKALTTLQDMILGTPPDADIASPNPTTGDFEIIFSEPPESVIVEIVSSTGRLLSKQEIERFAGRVLRITELQTREQGIYFVRIISPGTTSVLKIIKIRN